MKKILGISMMMAVLLLGACAADSSTGKDDGNKKVNGETSEDKGLHVEKKLLSVDVTIPASLIEDGEAEDVKEQMGEDGAKNIRENEDGSISFTMSKSDHKKMMSEMETGIIEMIEGLESGEDFASVRKVEGKAPFSKFVMSVDREAFENSFDGFANLTLAIGGMYYQALNGTNGENAKVTIELKDEETGEIFDSVVYPDALEE